jgi:hypothetical protein
MFDFLRGPKLPELRSTITFDERYCHSAGTQSAARTYEIAKGTTEIVFAFEDFDKFTGIYFLHNPYLPDGIKDLVRSKRGSFCAQLVQGAPYVCTDGVGSDGRISFRPDSLTPLGHRKRLRSFTDGIIAFGILQPATGQFHVLWATMYRSV